MTIEITQAQISHFICGVLCGMVESASCDGPLEEGNYTLIKKWEQREDGSWRGLNVSSQVMMIGYNCYAGCGCPAEDSRIPEFISRDWDRAEKIYMKLKNF